MGNTDKQSTCSMQCRQAGNEPVCPECDGTGKSERKPLIWRRRLVQLSAVCVVLLVSAVAYAIAKGMPVPDAIGAVLGVCVHMLLGL